MFTGIIEEIGKIISVTDKKIKIQASVVLCDTKIGDSIAVNGVCLTVTNIGSDNFEADISPETYRITALKELKSSDCVNLERAMPANGRFGGHIMSGHIDGIGKIILFEKISDSYNLKIALDEKELKYTVKKGSIGVNGISLTIANIEKNFIEISVIPHSFEKTNLKNLKIGNSVNIEVDIISKYVEKFLSTSDNKTGISMEFLAENGF